ncbi:hypothetical protein F5Y18DRAFT_245062 [Xylariaceae sp. FL1019]|nr:hypothetical protein F5Y18DRAFT_245062 [Xylariaceae sp. FL1019]
MLNQHQLDIIQAHPFGAHLGPASLSLIAIIGEPGGLDSASREVLQSLAFVLLPSLQSHVVSQALPSRTGYGSLREDIWQLISAVASGIVHNQLRPLLSTVLADPKPSDVDIWEQVYHAVAAAQSTPPRKPTSSFLHTPWAYRTSSIVNSSERRDHMDKVLRDELGVMYVDVPNFYEAFFGDIPSLETASVEIFQKCTDDAEPLFREGVGWTGWPGTVDEAGVLTWLAGLVERLVQWAQDYRPTTRRPLAQPNTPLEGAVAKRKLDVGFVDDANASTDARYHWSHILIPGELKSNPDDDTASKARLDLARYVKEVFTAQPTRRFVLAFTLCGSWMRLWEFDRLGGMASTKFDIHENGQRLVSTTLGFLWMDNDKLGLDPTIVKVAGQQHLEVQRHGKKERLILDQLIRGPQGIVGRATTCWRAYLEGDDSLSFVVKDSWQYPERDEEGQLLQEATDNGVTNVARYYYHETVQIGGKDDDIQSNIRKGLDVTKASNYRQTRLTVSSSQSRASSAGSKRSASDIGASLPPGKRSRSGAVSPTKFGSQPLPNRLHRRVILHDYGKPIYKASSRIALLRAMEECIQGHESLYEAGFLHRDISINNLIINEDKNNHSWPSFLIDLDLAIKIDRLQASGAKEKTGTRAFMAIGVLEGDGHSFMDDLESFFWVLFWICIHYDRLGQGRTGVGDFDEWNFANTEKLAVLKGGTVNEKDRFYRIMSQHFTRHYRVLIPCVEKLWRVVFPNGKRWRQEDKTLYSRMRQILRDAQNDPLVAAVDS